MSPTIFRIYYGLGSVVKDCLKWDNKYNSAVADVAADDYEVKWDK